MKRNMFLFLIILFFIPNVIKAEELFKYHLSFDEATQLAIANNFDIQLIKYDVLYSKETAGIYDAIFDTNLSANIGYRNNQNINTLASFGSKNLDNDYNLGLSKKIPSGTTVGIDIENNRNWTDSSLVEENLNHQSALELSIFQELGKNFFGLQDRGDIEINSVDIENTGFVSNDKIEDSLSLVQKAYWDLVLELEIVIIKEDMLKQAKLLYDLHQEKLNDGLVELPEAIASEANYKNRINELALSKNQVRLKENILKLLLNIEDSDASIVPTETLGLPLFTESSKEALKSAFDNRWDYKKANNEIKSKNIKLSLKKNNLWPEINLVTSFRRNGLGDSFNESVTNISDKDNPNFYAGLSIHFPLENTKAKSQLRQVEIEKAKALLNLKLIERKIAIGIIDRVRNCNIFKEVAINSEEIDSLQFNKLKEEEKRYNTGRSNTDTVIRFQEEFIRAKENSAIAKYQYHISLIDLEKAKGTLLKKYIGN